MQALYPYAEATRTATLPVSDGHALYVEEGGTTVGIPIVFLHGGPGSGCKPSHRQFFDPKRYRCFLIDQRGAGRSTPSGGTDGNTLQALVNDLETLRNWAGVERWVLFGGSWGAALALAYAQTHPERVLGMVLRGSFLARSRDLAWFIGDGARRLLPRAWHTFTTAITPYGASAVDWNAAVHGSDRSAALAVAQAWAQWSTEVVMYGFEHAPGDAPEPAELVLAKTRIELHYAAHQYFLEDNQLLRDCSRIPRVPIHLIHGQRDITCPPEAAWELHRALPWSTLEILRTAGHLSGESAIQDALLRAADRLALTLA